jgi:glutaredoxin
MKEFTMASRFLLSLIVFMMSVSAQAQVYKWVDADGKVTYSDVPPPKTAVKVETKSYSSSDESSVALPFELSQAVKNMPVTFYSTPNCQICDDGRNFLKQNGIPFSERTVTTNSDSEKLSSISGGAQLPVLLIGKTKLVGYGYTQWRSNLTQAGYPESNLLPADYQYPAPQPAAPVVAATKNTDQRAPAKAEPPRDPNGFQF